MKSYEMTQHYEVDETLIADLKLEQGARTPEQRLMLAVIERAIRDYLGGSPEDAREAGDWLYEEGENLEDQPFSFLWICEFLEIDPVNARTKLESALQHSREGNLPFFLDKRFANKRKVPDAEAA